jgi:hypothetical protein
MSDYQQFRVVYELTSTILCFILVWFMAKPYRYTKQARYVGLPLAFGLLGASYFLSAIAYAQLSFFPDDLLWVQLAVRAFAFVFLAATYRFPKKISETNSTSRLIWSVASTLIALAIITLIVAIIINPQVNFSNYKAASTYVRIFNVFCLTYVIVHVLRKHMTKPESSTLLIPLGYIVLAISQYSLIIWALDSSMTAWWGALALRWGSIAIFLYVAYITFYGLQKRANK